jgi:hypothetical protein
MANKDDEMKTLSEHAVDWIYDELKKKGFVDFNDGLARVNLLMCFQHLFVENYGEEKFKELDRLVKQKLDENKKTLN